MGEYARYLGQEVKIGTCESMYYLRADQAWKVTALPGNVDPTSSRDRASLRFRFPFPSEDGTAPGAFDYPLPDVVVSYPADLPAEHGDVMIETPKGASRRMSAMLPCPMVAPALWHSYVRAFTPAVRIAYQGVRGEHGALAVIVECAYCNGMWNLPEWEHAEPLVVSIRSEADRLRQLGEHRIAETHRVHGEDCSDPMGQREVRQAAELHVIADRIAAGYRVTVSS